MFPNKWNICGLRRWQIASHSFICQMSFFQKLQSIVIIWCNISCCLFSMFIVCNGKYSSSQQELVEESRLLLLRVEPDVLCGTSKTSTCRYFHNNSQHTKYIYLCYKTYFLAHKQESVRTCKYWAWGGIKLLFFSRVKIQAVFFSQWFSWECTSSNILGKAKCKFRSESLWKHKTGPRAKSLKSGQIFPLSGAEKDLAYPAALFKNERKKVCRKEFVRQAQILWRTQLERHRSKVGELLLALISSNKLLALHISILMFNSSNFQSWSCAHCWFRQEKISTFAPLLWNRLRNDELFPFA